VANAKKRQRLFYCENRVVLGGDKNPKVFIAPLFLWGRDLQERTWELKIIERPGDSLRGLNKKEGDHRSRADAGGKKM